MTGTVESSPVQATPVRAWLPEPNGKEAQVSVDLGARAGLWLGALAAALALLGFALLAIREARLLGCALLVAAGVLSVRAWGSVPPIPAFGTGTATPAGANRSRRGVALVGIMFAIGLGLAGGLKYLASPDETFGLAGVLWLAGLGVLVTATGAWPRQKDDIRPVGAAVPAVPGWTRAEVTVVAGLTVLAVVLRLWDLKDVPYNIYPDEIMTGTVATQAYLGGTNPSVFSTLWGGIDLPALWFFLIAGTLKLGGSTLAMLRLPAALFGAATVLPFYGLVRQVWGRAAAMAGSAVLAFSASDIHYSSVALNNILPQFFWASCFFFILRGLRTRRPLDWTLAGVAGGLSEYGYYGTRLLPFVLVAFLCYMLLVHWRHARTLAGHFALLALSYCLAFGPLLAYYLSHPGIYFGRATGTQVLSRTLSAWPDVGAMLAVIWPPLANTLLGVNTNPSQDLVYFAPLLLAGEAAMLVLGTALLIRQWRHPAAFLLLLSGMGAIFVGGTLVLYSASPFLAHLTPGFPAFYAAIAVPFMGIAQQLRGDVTLVPGSRPIHLPRAATVIGLILLVMGLLDLNFYFRSYYADLRVLDPRLQRPQLNYEIQTTQSRWQAALGPAYHVYVVGLSAQPYDADTTSYLIANQPTVFVRNPPADFPPRPPQGMGLAFVFYADTVQYRDQVAADFPGGTAGAVQTPYGEPLFYTYVLPP